MRVVRGRGEQGYTLVDVTVAAVILAIVLAIVGDYLFSAQNTVASSAARQDDSAAAQTALLLIENNVRFACDMAISGGTLYVQNSCGGTTPPPCASWSGSEWSQASGQLIETTASGSSVIGNGVTGLAFTANSSYTGLVTIQFNMRQPQDTAGDTAGVSVSQTLTARNMSASVGGTALCA